MCIALFYDVVDDYLDRRGEFRDHHLALARAARLVASYRIRPWTVVVGDDQAL